MSVTTPMGGANGIGFQPTGGGKAAITGDFLVTGDEVNPLIRELRRNGIEVTAIHSHMLTEQPRMFFIHFWANDDAVKLAKGLRAALDKTAIARTEPRGADWVEHRRPNPPLRRSRPHLKHDYINNNCTWPDRGACAGLPAPWFRGGPVALVGQMKRELVAERGTDARSHRHLSVAARASGMARRHVAVHLAVTADDAMSGRIAFILDSCPVRADALAARNDGGVLIAPDLEAVSLIAIRFAAARDRLVVGLLEFLKPPARGQRVNSSLTVLAGKGRRDCSYQ